MDLKTRKLIINGKLPKYNGGTFPIASRSGYLDFVLGLNSDKDGGVNPITVNSNVRNVNNQSVNPNPLPTTVTKDGITDYNYSPPSSNITNFKTSQYGSAMSNPWVQLGQFIGLGAINGYNKYTNQNELLNNAGTSTASSYGVNYQKINDIDSQKVLDLQQEAAKLSAFLNPAEFAASYDWKSHPTSAAISYAVDPLITGIFHATGLAGSSYERQKLELADAQRDALSRNLFRESVRGTQGIGQKEAERNSAYYNQPLYAKNGKDAGDTMGGRLPKFFSGKGVNTAYGIMPGEPNALTNKGEEILDTETGIMSHVGRGPNDTAPSYLRGKDAVITTNDGLAKKARMYYNRGDMAGVASVLQEQQMNHMLGKYKNGKLPRFEGGYIDPYANYMTNGLGTAASIWLMIDAYRQEPHRPSTYVNPYDAQALRDMAGARYELYPVAQMLLKDRARTDRALDMSGGLSGSLKYLGKVSNGANYYNAITDAMMRLGQGNISLKQAYNQARINSTANAARQQQQADQWDYDMFTKAHGARQQGIQMGLRNAMDYMNNYAANEFKRQQANYMLGLYDQQLSNDLYDLLMKYKNR